MQQFKYKISIVDKKQNVVIADDDGGEYGTITRSVLRNCDRRNTYQYMGTDGSTVVIGMKKRRFRDLNVASYIVQSDNYEFKLKERPGTNLLYFKVEGKFDNKRISLDEDWNGNLEVYFHGSHVMTVIEDPVTGETQINSGEKFNERSFPFIIGVLMFFMFKAYKRESWHIERAL
ncbi:hypothetical protein [Salinicoccus halitifaciens]|uniref:Uncharacterized protein n=1 Tax=Salinicoccus halitifaciens TaxID=1073415 RepID=A0ABV2EAS2_9STAP|nr:hypothetical protein [Salinicoccus halitifaciens]MCD2137647.1 hypothetical protein [Salinicoccus halitifaciens]